MNACRPVSQTHAPFLFSRIMSLAFTQSGPKSGLSVYVVFLDDCTCFSSAWQGRLHLLENMFKALQAAGLTLKPSKVLFRSREAKYLGHERKKVLDEIRLPEAVRDSPRGPSPGSSGGCVVQGARSTSSSWGSCQDTHSAWWSVVRSARCPSTSLERWGTGSGPQCLVHHEGMQTLPARESPS